MGVRWLATALPGDELACRVFSALAVAFALRVMASAMTFRTKQNPALAH
jgi:hypothetical protein